MIGWEHVLLKFQQNGYRARQTWAKLNTTIILKHFNLHLFILFSESRRRPKGAETNTPRPVGKEDQPYSHQIAEKPGNFSKPGKYCCVINHAVTMKRNIWCCYFWQLARSLPLRSLVLCRCVTGEIAWGTATSEVHFQTSFSSLKIHHGNEVDDRNARGLVFLNYLD